MAQVLHSSSAECFLCSFSTFLFVQGNCGHLSLVLIFSTTRPHCQAAHIEPFCPPVSTTHILSLVCVCGTPVFNSFRKFLIEPTHGLSVYATIPYHLMTMAATAAPWMTMAASSLPQWTNTSTQQCTMHCTCTGWHLHMARCSRCMTRCPFLD